MRSVDFFPIKCFLTKIESYQDILAEAILNKEKIQEVSIAQGRTCSPNHFTDFGGTVKNKSFEENLKKALLPLVEEHKLQVDVIDYWTAFYQEGSLHEPHLHKDHIFDRCNYSGILYLTSIGGTDFFSPHNMSDQSIVTVNGTAGDVFIFPSLLPHTFAQSVQGDRVIISFNLSITG